MASIRRTLDHSEGVELEEISLEHDGEVVDQAYLVRTLRSPEACGDEAIEPGIFLTFEEDVFELCDIRAFRRPRYVQRWRSTRTRWPSKPGRKTDRCPCLSELQAWGPKSPP